MSFRSLSASLVVTTFLVAPVMAGQVDWQGPAGSLKFGAQVAVLPNGNIVVTDPADPAGGAAYLYRPDHTLISKVTGVNPGATPTADYETIKIVVLKNGNYVLVNTGWSSASTTGVGMVAWGSATTGISGVISASNALVGSAQNDYVGSDGVMPLSNGNYIVRSRNWDNGSLDEAGAVTWGNGDGGTVGPVSSSNSLVGAKAREHVGWYAWTLSNGNYVALTHAWNNGTANVGAATWGNGASGTTGIISATNSLVGSTFNDFVGATVTPLTNGNYVVVVPYWDKNGIVDAGAVVWANGATGRKGVIAANIALTGDKAGNFVGYPRVVALTNGNYVVSSSDWEDATGNDQGAVTWGNGSTGRTGVVSAANSLVGDQDYEYVGDDPEYYVEGVVALSNGHYVVSTTRWGANGKTDLGAVTWGNGNSGTVGVVSAANSLVGSTSGDKIGLSTVRGMHPLSNGNYVVASNSWQNSEGITVGASTWRSGSASSPGVVSPANSVIGAVGIAALKDGNYVLSSDSGMSWTDGTVARNAPLSVENGLMRPGGVIAMDDGSYVVCQVKGVDGPNSSGAAAWVPKGENLLGELSAKNALVGTTAEDQVCTGFIDAGSRVLEDGRYMMFNYYWDNNDIINARALTLMTRGMAGPVGSSNSVVGTVGSAGESVTGRSGFSYDYDPVRKHAVVGRYASNVVSLLTAPNDSGPNLSISDVSISEGNSGTKVATFTVQLSAASASSVSYDISTANGTGTAGSDYVGSYLVGQTIPPGSTSKTFSVTINGDGASEADELFTVNVNNVAGAKLVDGQAVGKIVNDDGANLVIDDVAIVEGNSGTKQMTFSVRLSTVASTAVTFDIATANGSATAGSDYTAASQTNRSIAAGALSTSFSVSINGDTEIESDETIVVSVSNVVGATVADGQATGTITNDDFSGLPSLSIADVSVTEDNSGSKSVTFTLLLSAFPSETVTYDISTSNGTAMAGSDYVAKSLSAQTFTPGQNIRLFSVEINGDADVEDDETFFVTVSNVTGATVSDGQAIGTIINDDGGGSLPTLSIADVSIAEGNSGTKTATFTVSLSAAASAPVTYDIATSNGTATAGSDYVASSLSGQSIPAGQTSNSFSVTINGDTTVESDETFTVTLSNPSGATIADGSAIGTITNDDSSGGGPTLSIGDVSISEGNSGSKLATFTLTLSAPAATAVTYNIATAAGTATAPSDFVNKSQTGQSIAAGQTSKTFTVSIKGDTVTEPDETFFVNVTNVGGATLSDGQAAGTITNDDGVVTPTLSIADASISEGDAGTKTATFTVNLSAAAAGTLTYDIATSNGTATAGSDYVASSLTGQSIAAGQTSKTFSVTINGDTTVESDETFTVTLSNPSGATIADGSATGTITNDDSSGGGPTLSIGDVSIAEGNSGSKLATFTLTLSAPAATAVTYNIATAAGTATAPADFVNKSQTGQSIAAGQTSKTFTVSIKGDTVTEPDETFLVNVTNVAGATLADGQAVGTITNDDGVTTPTLSIADVSISEGNSGTKTATFTVSLSVAASSAVTYDIATSNGTATAGSDYVASSLTGQSIAAGATSKTFSVTINGDTTLEADETFTVTLSNPTGATIADGSGEGTITNDDGSGSPTLSIGDVSIAEGNAGTSTATFTVSLSAAAAGAVTYDIATSNGSATAGSDYVASSLSGQSIPAGQTSKTFSVTINGDTTVESDETFTVTLSNPSGATISDGSATGTITNDDTSGGGPALSIGDVTMAEGNALNTQFTFTVSLSAASASAVSFNIATADGSAIAGSDYTAKSLSGQTIAAGQISKTFVVLVKGDRVVEPNETFVVNVTGVTDATVADGQAIGTITNDDAGLVTIARVITGGLVDDIDDGNGQPVLDKDEYTLLLLDTARQICERAQAPTIVGIDGVESRWVLEELADTVNGLCQRERHYVAVFDDQQSGDDGMGFLVEAADVTRSEGARVLDARAIGKESKLAAVTVLANGHDRAMTVLLTREAPATQPHHPGDLSRYVATRRKLEPEVRLVVLGASNMAELVNASAYMAQLPDMDGLPILEPDERIFVSQSLLDGFGNTEVILPYWDVDPQVLRLQP